MNPSRTLAAWAAFLIAVIAVFPLITLLIVLPTTGPAEAKALMEPILQDWNYTATLCVGILGGLAGYDKWSRHQLEEQQRQAGRAEVLAELEELDGNHD